MQCVRAMTEAVRVLVVDDERTIVESAGDYLRARGFDVTTARELEEAEALVVVDEFDVVVTDVRLRPGGRHEGLALTAFVVDRAPATGVIVMTAMTSDEMDRSARENGACVVLHKPVPLPQLERNVLAIASRCTIRGAAPTLCDPLRGACGTNPGTSADLIRLGALLAAVTPGRAEEDNATTLRAILEVLARIDATDRPRVAGMLGHCLSGSGAESSILAATRHQAVAGAVAIEVSARLRALSRTIRHA